MGKILFIFKKAPFPAIVTILSFVVFIGVYWLMTAKSIEPHYFKGLIFAIPFICFGIITFFTAKGKLKFGVSSTITICLIFILGIGSLFMFIYIAIIESTDLITDTSKYERVLKVTGYPNKELIKYFPNKIPRNAKNVVFKYSPAFLQGGEDFNLKFETDSPSINNYSNEFSKKAKWIGKWSNSQTENNGIILGTFGMVGYDALPEDFTIYLFDSKPYHSNDWNHGHLSTAAISKQRNMIIFVSEDW